MSPAAAADATGRAAQGRAASRTRAAAARSTVPSRRPRGERRPPLSVLDRKALLEQLRRRRARLLLAGAGLVVAGSLGLVAAVQGEVTSQQLRLDRLDQQLSQAINQTQRLEVTRANLESPSRVLGIAEHRLHMVSPSSITYLTPAPPVGGSGSGGS